MEEAEGRREAYRSDAERLRAQEGRLREGVLRAASGVPERDRAAREELVRIATGRGGGGGDAAPA